MNVSSIDMAKILSCNGFKILTLLPSSDMNHCGCGKLDLLHLEREYSKGIHIYKMCKSCFAIEIIKIKKFKQNSFW